MITFGLRSCVEISGGGDGNVYVGTPLEAVMDVDNLELAIEVDDMVLSVDDVSLIGYLSDDDSKSLLDEENLLITDE